MKSNGFAFIGGPELAIGLRFAGVPGETAVTREAALAAFRRVLQSDARIVVIDRDAADLIRPELVEWQFGGRYPLTVEIPSLEDGRPEPTTLLELIREAVGLAV